MVKLTDRLVVTIAVDWDIKPETKPATMYHVHFLVNE